MLRNRWSTGSGVTAAQPHEYRISQHFQVKSNTTGSQAPACTTSAFSNVPCSAAKLRLVRTEILSTTISTPFQSQSTLVLVSLFAQPTHILNSPSSVLQLLQLLSNPCKRNHSLAWQGFFLPPNGTKIHPTAGICRDSDKIATRLEDRHVTDPYTSEPCIEAFEYWSIRWEYWNSA